MVKIKGKISDALDRLELTGKSLILFLVISLVISVIAGSLYSKAIGYEITGKEESYFFSKEFGDVFSEEIKELDKDILAILYKKDKSNFTRNIKANKKEEIFKHENKYLVERNKLGADYEEEFMSVLSEQENKDLQQYMATTDLYIDLSHYERLYQMIFDYAKEVGLSQDKIDAMNILSEELKELNEPLVEERDEAIKMVNKKYELVESIIDAKGELPLHNKYTIEIVDPLGGVYASSNESIKAEKLTHIGMKSSGMTGNYVYYQVNEASHRREYTTRTNTINEYVGVELEKLNELTNTFTVDKNYIVRIVADREAFITGAYSDIYNMSNVSLILKFIVSVLILIAGVFIGIKKYENKFFEFYRERNIHIVLLWGSIILMSVVAIVFRYVWGVMYVVVAVVVGYYILAGILISSDIAYIVNHGFKKRFIKEKRVKSKKKGMNIQKLRESIFSKNLKKGDKVLRIMYISGIVFGVITIIVSGFFALDTLFRFSDSHWANSHWILNYWPKWVISIMAVIGPIIMIVVHLYQGIKLRKIQNDIADIDRIIDNIANGDFDVEFRSAELRELTLLRENIASIDKGFKVAVEDELKSARMKSELITNVSHDLKTPLTSIINYVDLLKVDDISEVDREEYLRILDNKSKRLKALIEDLFEASKASTGNIILNIENIDMVSVLRQAFAEFKEKIDDSTLDFKINIPEGKVNLDLDGAKLWRVFENLIGNAIKYSMDNSRVYIELREYKDKVVFEIKNMSGYELNCDPSELKERFKRADASRHTEGSGLGLAIANSLVELQGGTLDIAIDGDLFKVKVIFEKK